MKKVLIFNTSKKFWNSTSSTGCQPDFWSMLALSKGKSRKEIMEEVEKAKKLQEDDPASDNGVVHLVQLLRSGPHNPAPPTSKELEFQILGESLINLYISEYPEQFISNRIQNTSTGKCKVNIVSPYQKKLPRLAKWLLSYLTYRGLDKATGRSVITHMKNQQDAVITGGGTVTPPTFKSMLNTALQIYTSEVAFRSGPVFDVVYENFFNADMIFNMAMIELGWEEYYDPRYIGGN